MYRQNTTTGYKQQDKENNYKEKVINIAEKTKNIGFYVSKKEYSQIKRNVRKYGYKNTSDYIRSAIAFFDERRYNASKQSEINIIQDCIDLLHDHKKMISNQMMQESLKNLGENLEESPSTENQKLEGFEGKLSKNFEGLEDETFKESDENLESPKTYKNKKEKEPFENVIQTLIRITRAKGKPSDKNFEFLASRCDKSANEIEKYYIDNYDFFVRESDKYC